MAPDVLAVLIGSFELIVLLILLALPVVLTVSYIMLVSRFRTTNLDVRMAEAKLLSDLAQIEAQATSKQADYVTSSETSGF
ncbi:MAG: hypothetical protein ACYSWP_11065 [Planctomycetota bacterium]|jgi:hypothetical protein